MRRAPQVRIDGTGKLRLTGDWESAPLDGLCQAARLAAAVEKLQRDLVRRARAAGGSWTDVGAALGISRQSAWERFSASSE
jgi:hypothetical protein